LLLIVVLFAAPSAHAVCAPPTTDPRPEIAMETVLGTIRLRLLGEPGEAPATVANFLNYVERGDYDGSFLHRLIPGFVLQGGGYTWDPIDEYQTIASDPPVVNEPNVCNVRGTVAMAKVGGQVNSATNQFFFNLIDNTTTLGNQNGGFTAFAQVVPEDMPIVDEIAALHRESGLWLLDDPIGPFLDNLPVLELLDRNPAGWGCIASISPDPSYRIQVDAWWPEFVQTCGEGDPGAIAFQQALDLAIADFAPQFPERLVMVQSVPEPGAALGLAAAAATLGGLRRRKPRRAAIPL
jgi:cyclophilin family peptidyl-prolyl cis-trans isomerase